MVTVSAPEIAFDNLEKTSGTFMRLSMEIKSLLEDTGLGAKTLNADNFPQDIRTDAGATEDTTYGNLFSHFVAIILRLLCLRILVKRRNRIFSSPRAELIN